MKCGQCSKEMSKGRTAYETAVSGKTYSICVDAFVCEGCGPEQTVFASRDIIAAEREVAVSILRRLRITGEEVHFARKALGFSAEEICIKLSIKSDDIARIKSGDGGVAEKKAALIEFLRENVGYRIAGKNDLTTILDLHRKWCNHKKGGVRANLAYENLSGAHLSCTNLTRSVLNSANLSCANLTRSVLNSANLTGADLTGADLTEANLTGADLIGANLTGADLIGANLTGANLSRANLTGANLADANLTGAMLPEFQIPQSGDLTGFKKVRGGVILELLIPDGARRTRSLSGEKCRCERALVVRALNSDLKEFWSMFNRNFIYRVGEFVEVKNYNGDIRYECKPGIHFFMKREEAEVYYF